MDKKQYVKQEKSLTLDLSYARNQLCVFNLALKQYLTESSEDVELYYYIIEKIKVYKKAVDDCEKLLIDLHERYVKAVERGEVKWL